MDIIAMYPGSFDPITNGHVDLVRRASELFEKVILAVAENPGKKPLFSLQERISLAEKVLVELSNVEVIGFQNLMVDSAREQGANVIIRGLRAISDFDFEVQLASMNRKLNPHIETIFLSPEERFTFVSSSLVKEIALHGGDVSKFVHSEVDAALKKKTIG